MSNFLFIGIGIAGIVIALSGAVIMLSPPFTVATISAGLLGVVLGGFMALMCAFSMREAGQ